MVASNAALNSFFDVSSVPPPGGSKDFSLYLWEKVRDAGIQPRFHSGYDDDVENRLDFLTGARLMGLELVDPQELEQWKLDNPRLQAIVPQQLQIVDTLNTGFDAYAVEIPRRASKTTTIFCLLLGRMARRPGYQVTFSAQNGVAGSRRLREWAGRLDAINPPDFDERYPWLAKQKKPKSNHLTLWGEELPEPQPTGRGFRIMRGEVGKGIYFDNGSQMLVLKPDADAYRGEAADCSWLDEAQEIDPEEGADLLAGIVPLQDTKPGASIIISGTAGEFRVGVFWEYLDRARADDSTVGIIDFAAEETTPWEIIEDEDAAMALLETVHPGIGTLTTLEKMRKNYRTLPKPQWAREYLSMWPETAGALAIPSDQWFAAAEAQKPRKPARVAFGLAIKPGGSAASIVAAWRNSKGQAFIEVVDHRQGTQWIPERSQELTQKYRGSTIAYDDIGEGKATATEMLSLKPKPRIRIQTYRENAAGCVQFLRDLERGTIKHFNQSGLNEAVACAAKRHVRGDVGVWLWTVAQPGDDITCLDAATRALRNWDQHFANKTTGYAPIMGE